MGYYNIHDEIRNQIRNGLKRLNNEEFYFYGVFNNCFKIDDMILEVIEDPDDGYRSHLGAVCHYKGYNDLKRHFFDKPLGKIVLHTKHIDSTVKEDSYAYEDTFDGWVLDDVDTSHRWLTFGTNNTDDYYPYFVFSYTPDTEQKRFIEVDSDYIPFKERHPELLLKYASWFDGTRFPS